MERMMKTMAVACMLALGLALAGCGDAGSSSAPAASSSSTVTGAAGSSSAAAAESTSQAADEDTSEKAEGSESPSAEAASSSTSAETDRVPFVGAWKMVAMSNGTDVLRLEDAAQETRENLDISFTLDADGSAAYANPLYRLTGTWTPLSSTVAKIEFEPTDDFEDGAVYEATLDDGTLAIQEDGLVMLLEKA